MALACASMVTALVLTHVFWPYLRPTPFLLLFSAAVLSSWLGGRQAGFLAILIGAVGIIWFPPPLPHETRLIPFLVGFIVVSSAFAWLAARRIEIESALRASEARLSEAQRVANVGSWEMNVRDGTETWSDQVYAMFGVERGAVSPNFDTFARFLHPEDRSLVGGILQQAYADHQPFECDIRIVRSTNETRTLHVHGRVMVDDTGRVTRVVGTAQDISDRKAAEERTAQSERRLRTIIDAEPACVKLVSADGLLLEMNPAGLQMIGAATASDVIGRRMTDLVHPDDRSRFEDAHSAALAGHAVRTEFRIGTRDAGDRTVDSHSVPFDTEMNGRQTRAVLSVTSDITQQKRLEDQLRQSQKMEAIGVLAGGIAHDFNNLLTAISGFTDLALQSLDLSDSRRDNLQEVSSAAQRGASLVRQLLAISRRQALQLTIIDLTELVADLQKLLRRTVPESVEVTVALNHQATWVRADRGQLEQIVLNLVINAKDAMPDGGQLYLETGLLTVTDGVPPPHVAMLSGQFVRLTVRDTGVGMSPRVQAHIFEPFFTTKGPGAGTGLGLATVYAIVKQSDGFIAVRSTAGHGTTFDVYLPLVDEPGAVDRLEEAATPRTDRICTILIAEDDDAVRLLAHTILSSRGYTVIEARDGLEALLVARDYPGTIDLLITDIVMPGLNGPELAMRLTADQRACRVLYISGHPERVRGRAGFTGGLSLLAKPFRPEDLLQSVDESLGGVS